jgi:hypothetical protein
MNRPAILLGSLLLASACDDDGSATAEPSCPSAEILAVLDEHIAQLGGAGQMLSGHPGAREATGFFLFPGLDPGTVAIFAGPLVMECSTPMSYDEYCGGGEEIYCSQIECTGEGTGWIFHFRLPGPHTSGEFQFASATIANHWAEGARGTTFDIAASITGPGGLDFSFTGEGRMEPEEAQITETYPSLVEGGALTVTFSETPTSHSGEVTVGGQVVATADPDTGRLVPSDACQP